MRSLFLLLIFAAASFAQIGFAEERMDERVVVSAAESGEEFEEPGGYGQPQWAERSRASATTKLYVLSPWEVFLGVISESRIARHGHALEELTQEIEVGLPFRFELDLENQIRAGEGNLAEHGLSAGLRYALADWGKIPLNPALSANYLFPTGPGGADRFGSLGDNRRSSGYEVRLLLGQEFVPRFQWAANVFFRDELGSSRTREIGFAQDLAYLAVADKFEIGAEMRFTHESRRERPRMSATELVVGPSVNWKPNLHTVVSLAPLIGCTADSPRLAILAAVSLEFGGGESKTVPTHETW